MTAESILRDTDLVDALRELINFWRVLQSPDLSEQMIRRLKVSPFSSVEFVEALEPAIDPVERAVGFCFRISSNTPRACARNLASPA